MMELTRDELVEVAGGRRLMAMAPIREAGPAMAAMPVQAGRVAFAWGGFQGRMLLWDPPLSRYAIKS